MIDDHPSMIEGYKSILSFNDFDVDIKTTAVTDGSVFIRWLKPLLGKDALDTISLLVFL